MRHKYIEVLEGAEAWYRKVLDAFKTLRDDGSASKVLNNLANLLQNQPDRLPEARQLTEEALAIKQTLDPAASQIWTTYTILAKIADQQHQQDSAQAYRRLARQAKAAFAGTQYELQKHEPLMATVVAAVQNAEVRQQLEPVLEDRVQRGLGNLVAAIRRALEGERDENSLWEGLDLEDSMIISTILRRIQDTTSGG